MKCIEHKAPASARRRPLSLQDPEALLMASHLCHRPLHRSFVYQSFIHPKLFYP